MYTVLYTAYLNRTMYVQRRLRYSLYPVLEMPRHIDNNYSLDRTPDGVRPRSVLFGLSGGSSDFQHPASMAFSVVDETEPVIVPMSNVHNMIGLVI